jgi:hypothetical protein
MNWFANLLVVSGAGVAGYFAEPSLRLELTGIAPSSKSAPLSPALLKIDLAAVDPALLPKTVVLKQPAQVTDSSSGLKMAITAGSHVKLVRLENGLAVISPGAETIEGTIQPNDTDLREQLAAILPPPAASAEIATGESPATAEKPAATVAPGMVDPADPFAPIAADPAAATPAPTATEPAAAAPAPAAVVDPNDPKADPFFADANAGAATTAEPAAATAFTAMPADDIVKAMQESIKAEQIKEFKFDQVSEWTAGEPEKVGGKDFNTGLVSYQGKTFLGVKAIQAKAYIGGDGKVIRWIMPKSGKELQ